MKTNFQILIVFISVCITGTSFSQVTQLNNIRPSTGDNFLGWNGTGGNAGSLEIRNDFTNHINFSTNGSQKMTILGSSGSTDGNVGIGITTPAIRLPPVRASLQRWLLRVC